MVEKVGVGVGKYGDFFFFILTYVLQRKFSRHKIVEGRKIAHNYFLFQHGHH